MSSLIRHAVLDDEPVVIAVRSDDSNALDQSLDSSSADERESPLPEPAPIDPLFEREKELRRWEARLEEMEGRLVEEKDRLESHVAQLAALVGNAQHETAALVKDAEHQAVQLGLAIARRLLRVELKLHPETIARVVEDALEATGREVVVRIRVAPEELPILQSAWNASPPTLVSRDVALMADPKVHPGGCLIDTQTGTIDGRLESQWEVIEAAFQNLERENHANDD